LSATRVGQPTLLRLPGAAAMTGRLKRKWFGTGA